MFNKWEKRNQNIKTQLCLNSLETNLLGKNSYKIDYDYFNLLNNENKLLFISKVKNFNWFDIQNSIQENNIEMLEWLAVNYELIANCK
jgi:hypothetical protein